MSRTRWVDLLVHEQLKKILGDVKPEPDSFLFPWEVLEVNLVYNTPISEPTEFGQNRPQGLLPTYRIL